MHITTHICLQDTMTCIEREVESTTVKMTITASNGIELNVTPGPGAFVVEKHIGRLFKMTHENKDLCIASSAGLSNPKILEAMLKFAPISVEYFRGPVATVKFASSFYGVDTSLSLVAIRMREQKPRDADGLEIAK